jgi:hypothetical protein
MLVSIFFFVDPAKKTQPHPPFHGCRQLPTPPSTIDTITMNNSQHPSPPPWFLSFAGTPTNSDQPTFLPFCFIVGDHSPQDHPRREANHRNTGTLPLLSLIHATPPSSSDFPAVSDHHHCRQPPCFFIWSPATTSLVSILVNLQHL